MSRVTDTFLLTSVMFDPKDNPEDAETFAKIDKWLDEVNLTKQRLKRIDDKKAVYGGGKMMQASVWAGAFNYLNLQEFIEFLKTLNFNDWAQLCYQDENDSGFTLVQIQEEDDDR